MSRLLRLRRALRAPLGRAVASPTRSAAPRAGETGEALPRSTIAAITFGAMAAVAATTLVGPSLGNVWADEQDQRAIYMNIMAREHGAPPVRAVARPATPAPAVNALRALMNIDRGAVSRQLPPNTRAYAPLPSVDAPLGAERLANIRLDKPLVGRDQPATGAGLTRRSVCVRLCDGFAFPVADYRGESDTAAHTAVCSGLCPGAPTRLYVAGAGSDDIANAVSTRDGKPYSALPAAFRYVSTRDAACSCHAPGESLSKNVSLLRDFTLR